MKKLDRFDIASIAIVLFVTIFSALRYKFLPQFFDGYYHLSVANGFIQSGGWSGWAWWDFAPLGRPQLYPPLYHLFLVLCQKIGLEGLTSIRLAEVLIVPAFFLVLWHSLRFLTNSKCSFFATLTLSSFFAFYSSVSGNVPATSALIFGLLSWVFLKKKKVISAILCLGLSFYTHAGLPWIFTISLLSLAIFDKEYRKIAFKTILFSLLLALPFIIHQLRYFSYLKFENLIEERFTQFNVFIISLGVISFFLYLKKKSFALLLFYGYLIGSFIIFAKYRFRLFSAQGIVGFVFFSSLLLQETIDRLSLGKRKIILFSIVVYLFFFSSTFSWNKKGASFILTNSTYINFITAKSYQTSKFTSFFYPKAYYPVVELIEDNTSDLDIISSNEGIIAQIFSAFTSRPIANSMLGEVQPKGGGFHYDKAKIFIWLKYTADDKWPKITPGWKNLYENDLFFLFLNTNYEPVLARQRAALPFSLIGFILLLIGALFIKDNFFKGSSKTA